MIMALALIPLDKLDVAYEIIMIDAPNEEKISGLDELLNYFKNTLFDPIDSIFPRAEWNHFKNFSARTTNSLEGFHSGLKKEIKEKHPNIQLFIESIQKRQQRYDTKVDALYNGNRNSPVNSKYRKMNERYKNGVAAYEASERTGTDVQILLDIAARNISDTIF